jgi:hypothetical protein
MTRVLAIFIVVVTSTVRSAFGQNPCTQETLRVEGSPVTIAYCIGGPARTTPFGEVVVLVTETDTAPGGTLRRATELHFIAGEGVSRVIESLDLTKIGLTGTLHLTLAYTRGLVHVEGALLTPGAITVK